MPASQTSDATPAGQMPVASVDDGASRSSARGLRVGEELARAFASGLIVAGSPEARAVVTGGWLDQDGRRFDVGPLADVVRERGVEEGAGDGRPADSQGVRFLSSGFPSLDRLLPAGGVRPGKLVELLLSDDCSGGITLACAIAMRVAATSGQGRGGNGRGLLVVVDRFGDFHPPSVFGWDDWPRCRLVVARPPREEDEIWTIDQALRCPGVAAVVSWPRRVHPTSMRRWQLAARQRSGQDWGQSWGTGGGGRVSLSTGGPWPSDALAVEAGGVGLVVRPAADVCRPSWAEVRLLVEPLAREGESANRSDCPRASPGWSGLPGYAVGIRSIAWRITRLEGPVDAVRRTADVVMDLATGTSVSVAGLDAPEDVPKRSVTQSESRAVACAGSTVVSLGARA